MHLGIVYKRCDLKCILIYGFVRIFEKTQRMTDSKSHNNQLIGSSFAGTLDIFVYVIFEYLRL